MRLLVIARWVPERERLDTIGIPEAARAKGHACAVVASHELVDQISLADINAYDAIVCRFSDEPITDALVSTFAETGIAVVGAGNGIWYGDDQVRTLRSLAEAQIPTPHTMMIESPEQIEAVFNYLGRPMVTKDPKTMAGVGVRLAETEAQVRTHLQQLGGKRPLIAQRFYAECAGADCRLFVVEDEIAGAIRRVAQPGEFRANLWLGGTPRPYAYSNYEASLAIAARKAIGIDIAGIDILTTVKGPLVVEVNHNPGATGIERAAELIVQYAERKARTATRTTIGSPS
jgi:ribosomal protein S6--L-glutamate ligase